MKKKVVLFTIPIVIIVMAIMITILNNKEVQVENKNVCKILSFTINDNGTDIEVKVNDKNYQNLIWNEVVIYLYDSNDNTIKKINKKVGNNNDFFIHLKEKYTQVEKINCIAYGTK